MYDLSTVHSDEDVPGLVVRCRSCPMWFKRLPNASTLPTQYPGEYGDDPMATTYLVSESAREMFRTALRGVQIARCGSTAPRLLDIGAAQGTLLEEAQRLGFAAEGIDACEANVADARAKGLDVVHAAAEDLDRENEFDVVTMMDLLEHLRDPASVLAAAGRALAPGGELVVYTPNHRAVTVVIAKALYAFGVRRAVQEIFGRNHVSFFDDQSLPWAVERAGLRVRAIEFSRYDTSRPGQHVPALSLLGLAMIERLAQPLNRVFRMLAYAQKPASPA